LEVLALAPTMDGIEETVSAMTAIRQHPGTFLLVLLLSAGLMAATAWSAPQPKPIVIMDGEQSTPADGNMDHVVGEELC
jgi:hypothetical protein